MVHGGASSSTPGPRSNEVRASAPSRRGAPRPDRRRQYQPRADRRRRRPALTSHPSPHEGPAVVAVFDGRRSASSRARRLAADHQRQRCRRCRVRRCRQADRKGAGLREDVPVGASAATCGRLCRRRAEPTTCFERRARGTESVWVGLVALDVIGFGQNLEQAEFRQRSVGTRATSRPPTQAHPALQLDPAEAGERCRL